MNGDVERKLMRAEGRVDALIEVLEVNAKITDAFAQRNARLQEKLDKPDVDRRMYPGLAAQVSQVFKCAIRDCGNSSNEGRMEGRLCAPCSNHNYRHDRELIARIHEDLQHVNLAPLSQDDRVLVCKIITDCLEAKRA